MTFTVEIVGEVGNGSEMVYMFMTNDTLAELSNFTTFHNGHSIRPAFY